MRSASSVCSLHPVSPVLRGRALKKKATRRSVHTHDANGYQATSSDRCFLYVSSVSRIVWEVSVLKHCVLYDTLVVGPRCVRRTSIQQSAWKGNSQKCAPGFRRWHHACGGKG